MGCVFVTPLRLTHITLASLRANELSDVAIRKVLSQGGHQRHLTDETLRMVGANAVPIRSVRVREALVYAATLHDP